MTCSIRYISARSKSRTSSMWRFVSAKRTSTARPKSFKRRLLIRMPISTATVGKAAVASTVTSCSEAITCSQDYQTRLIALAQQMFFEVFQARVDDLLHSVHFGPQEVADIVDVAICVCE